MLMAQIPVQQIALITTQDFGTFVFEVIFQALIRLQ